MKTKWESMRTHERDLFIAKEVLKFTCFNKDGGTDWYNGQYSLGHWRYSTNLEDALDMFNRVMGENRQACIIMGNEYFECNVIRDGIEPILVNFTSNSLPVLFCHIAIYLKGKTAQL